MRAPTRLAATRRLVSGTVVVTSCFTQDARPAAETQVAQDCGEAQVLLVLNLSGRGNVGGRHAFHPSTGWPVMQRFAAVRHRRRGSLSASSEQRNSQSR